MITTATVEITAPTSPTGNYWGTDGALYNEDGYPTITTYGVRCGGSHYGTDRAYHANAASVKACYRITREQEEIARADAEHDAYCARAWESRFDDGYAGSEEEARDRWLESLAEAALAAHIGDNPDA